MTDQSQSPDISREQHYLQLEKIQKRQTRRYILFPFLLLFIIMALVIAILLSLRTPEQLAVVSDLMFTFFVLCPLMICFFPFVLLVFLLVGLMGRLHDGTKSPLRRLENWSYTMEKRVETWTSLADKRVLNWAVKFAPIRRILTIFDEPSSDN